MAFLCVFVILVLACSVCLVAFGLRGAQFATIRFLFHVCGDVVVRYVGDILGHVSCFGFSGNCNRDGWLLEARSAGCGAQDGWSNVCAHGEEGLG
jgi:hypothetical protein